MELQISSFNEGLQRTIEVKDEVFGCPYNEPLIHQVVMAYLAGGRSGTVKQKSRSEVSGSKRKLWKQKGTGRARVGAGNVNIWRGGGMAFPARPQDFSQKVNKKMYQAALRSILSELIRDQRTFLLDNFMIPSPKTGILVKQLSKINAPNALIVLDKVDNQLNWAAKNIPTVEVCEVKKVNPVLLLSFKKILITEPAIRQLEEWLS